MLTSFNHLFYTELLLLVRRSQDWLYPLGFFVIVLCVFPLAFTPDPAFLEKYIPGCIWMAALFANVLAVETIFYTDLEDGHLEQLLLSEVPLTLLVLAKLAAQWIATSLPLILLTPLIGLMFHLSSNVIFAMCLGLLLGTPILTLIGCLCVALTLGLQQQGVLLGLLILPLVTPVLIFGVNIAQQAQAHFSIIAASAFLAGLLVLVITLLPWAIAATLQISLDD
jgi:heme exporter protein B